MSDDKYPLLHIYAQDLWHDPAFIVGTREGLETLQRAIQEALDSSKDGSETAYASDGEGYSVFVSLVEDRTMSEAVLPYAGGAGREFAFKGKDPSSIVDYDFYIKCMKGEK